jgi:hypothetical protein
MGRKSSPKPTQQSASTLEICPQCQTFVGRNYPECPHCREVVEQPIKTAWQALLHTHNIEPNTDQERELAATILADSDQYWWSEVEAAMRRTSCPTCGGPLGYGSPDCTDCISRSDMLWGRDLEFAPDGTLSRNEHARRVMIRGLGQSHRHSAASLEGWRLYLPFLLSGPQPGGTRDDVRYAQTISAWIKAGRGHELASCRSIAEMYEITRQGRR